MKEILLTITRLAVLCFLVSSMSGIGLGLTLQQIVAPLRNPRLVIPAVVANFIIAPVLAIGIGRLLRLDEPFALGLLLLGLAAGAPFMPKIVAIAKGDLALSVGLMVLLMVGTTILLPVAMPRLVEGVQVNPWKIVRFLALLLLLPLVAGLVVKARLDSVAARLRPVRERVSTISLLAMLVLIMAINFKGVLCILETGAILAAILFAVLSALSGWLLGGKDAARRTVFGLGTELRNIPAALVVSTQNFKGSQCVSDGHCHHADRNSCPAARRKVDWKADSRCLADEQSDCRQLNGRPSRRIPSLNLKPKTQTCDSRIPIIRSTFLECRFSQAATI